MKSNKLLKPVKYLLMATLAVSLAVPALAEISLYRYTNDKGIQVIDHSIPPEMVKNGYEVISMSGKVLRVVPPALSEEEIAAKAERQQLEVEFERLRRRYASVADLESAKSRKLESIQTSITVLESNILSINNRISEFMTKAADRERAGRKVPQNLLDNISAAKEELEIAKKRLVQRQAEYNDVAERFDADVAVFERGMVVIEATN